MNLGDRFEIRPRTIMVNDKEAKLVIHTSAGMQALYVHNDFKWRTDENVPFEVVTMYDTLVTAIPVSAIFRDVRGNPFPGFIFEEVVAKKAEIIRTCPYCGYENHFSQWKGFNCPTCGSN